MPRYIGRYEILGELGRGGFGHVYRARDPQVNRPVAVKTLASDGDPGMLTRFRNEAASTGRLDHRNIVIIHDFGDHEGTPYIVMELLDGRNLKQAMAGSTPMPLLTKVRTMAQIAAGLQHAHSHGIIHRDVKPANIMVLNDRDGTAKIMDFGIALMTQAANSRVTQDGEMIGTFGYMAPEQFQRAAADARSDIFAFGVIFYELLCGVHPFHAADVRRLTYNIMNVEPVPIGELAPDCPMELRSVIARLLSKDPETRYQNLDDFSFDIEPVLEDLRRKRTQELLTEAQAAKSAQQFDTALELVRQARDLMPGDEAVRREHESIQSGLRAKAIRPKVDDLVRRGKEKFAAGKWLDAVPLFESAIRLADVPEVVPLLEEARMRAERSREADRLVAEAETAYKRGDPARAAGKAQQALELVPEDAAAQRVLAACEATLAEERKRARLVEALARTKRLRDIRSWEEALRLVGSLEREFPGVPEVVALAEEIHAGWEKDERERLLASGLSAVRRQVQSADFTGALAALEKLARHYPESSDVQMMLGFVRQELETQARREYVEQSIAGAKAAAARHEYEKAMHLLDAALAKYPADSDLQNQRRTLAVEQFEAARRMAAEKAVAAANQLRSEARFQEALPPLEGFLQEYGSDTAITNLRETVLKEQESARRAAELREFVHRARDLMAKDRPEEATELLKAPPSHLKNNSEVTKLLDAAKMQAFARRQAALGEALRNAETLGGKEHFKEGLEALAAFQNRYGEDAQIDEAHNKLKQAEGEKAKRTVIAEATGFLAKGDLGGATALFSAMPQHIREQPEVQNLEREAQRVLEERKAREAAAARAIAGAKELRSRADFTGAIRPLDEYLAAHGASAEISALREAILKDQEAARSAEERRLREKQAKEAIAAAAAARKQEKFAEALQPLDDFLRTHGADAAIAEMRAAIVREAELKQREKSIQEIIAKTTALIGSDPASALALVQAAPAEIRGNPEIQNLEKTALRALEEQRVREERARLRQETIQKIGTLLEKQKYREASEALNPLLAAEPNDAYLQKLGADFSRQAALQEALRKAETLRGREQFEEGLEALAAFQKRHGEDAQIDDARNKLEHAEGEKAKRAIVEKANTFLAKGDLGGATALFAAAPHHLREQPEVQNLEREAQRALEAKNAREAAVARAIAGAEQLRSRGDFSAALPLLDEFLATYGAAAEISALRDAIVKEQEAANIAEERRLREKAAKEATAWATTAGKQENFAEALQTLDDFLRTHGPDAAIAEMRAAIVREAEQKQREKETKALLAKATALAVSDPAAALAVVRAAPEDIRKHPEIQNLEKTALRTLEEQRVREERARQRQEAIQKIGTLLEKQKYREASQALNPLLAAEPNDPHLLKLRTNIDAGLRRALLKEIEKLCQLEQFDAAAAMLKATPERDAEVSAALNRVQSLQTQALEKQAVQALQASADIRGRDPRQALSILEALPGALRSRPDIEKAVRESQAAIEKADLAEAGAAIQSLCADGKFRKARARHQEALARFGTNPQLVSLGGEIQAGLASKRFPAKYVAIAAGAIAVVIAGGWLYTHRGTSGGGFAPVEIRTDPAGASVTVGDHTCQTPNCKFDLPPGTYQLRAELRGYQTANRALTIGSEKRLKAFDVPLDPILVQPPAGKPTGTLVVDSKLPEAMVYLDRAPLKRTDAQGKLSATVEAGNHTIRVEKPGYQTPAEQRVRIAENRSQPVAFNLIPQNAVLELRGAPAGAEVRANGTLIGRANGPLLSMSIPPGLQSLRITEGTASKDLSQAFGPGETITLEWANVAPPKIAAPTPVTPTPTPPVTPAVIAPKADPAEVEWDLVRTAPDPAAVQSYIEKYPGSRHVAEAQTRLEALAWVRLDQNNIRALRDHLVRFRGGAHETEARARVAELAWAGVDQKDEQALRTFIQQNGDNPHRPQAQTALDKLIQQSELQRSQAEIQAALRRVNAIFSSEKFDRQKERELKEVWPSPPQSILSALTVSHVKISLENPQAYTVDGDSATVVCSLVSKGAQANAPQRVKLTLQRAAGGWTVQSLTGN